MVASLHDECKLVSGCQIDRKLDDVDEAIKENGLLHKYYHHKKC